MKKTIFILFIHLFSLAIHASTTTERTNRQYFVYSTKQNLHAFAKFTNTDTLKSQIGLSIEYNKNRVFVNIAQLRKNAGFKGEKAEVLGYYEAGDEGAGKVYWNDSSTTADNGGTIFSVSGVSVGRWIRVLKNDIVDVAWFGAKADYFSTKTNNKIFFQNAINTGKNVVLGLNKSYYIGGRISIKTNNFKIDLNNSTINFGGDTTGFVFGRVADTPTIHNVKIENGILKNDVPSDNVNRNFIIFNSVSSGIISNITLYNVSNGGIYVTAGSDNLKIDNIKIRGVSGFYINRGIWLNGSTSSDFRLQLVNITNMRRNNLPLPLHKIRNVILNNIDVSYDNKGYGIYLMNSENVSISDCLIDIGQSPNRCIAVNNYSPYTKITGCTFKGNATSTGILVTQASSNVLISKNIFEGDFKTGRDIYVAFLAEVVISNNTFKSNSDTKVLIDNGGNASIVSNQFFNPTFISGKRIIDIYTIDLATIGTSTYGDSATLVSDIQIRDNTFRNCNVPIRLTQLKSKTGNVAGFSKIVIEDNKAYNFDLGSISARFLNISSLNSTNKSNIVYLRNYTYPLDYTICAGILDTKGFAKVKSADIKNVLFLFNVDGGIVKVKNKGDSRLFQLSATQSEGSIILQVQTSGDANVILENIVPSSPNMKTYSIINSSPLTWRITAIDHLNKNINLSTTPVSFHVFFAYKY